MMKAYVILAHKHPEQLFRLVQRLADISSFFFIHIDKKANISDFRNLKNLGHKIIFVERVTANWGEFGLVKATLNGLKAVRNYGHTFERIILLSGQDYPIKSNAEIDQYFKSTNFTIFLEYYSLPDEVKWKPGGGLYRVNKYFFGLRLYQKFLARATNLLAAFLPFLQRKIPSGMKPYAGSGWWMIDNDALNYILTYVEENPGYLAFHQYTFAADELFFHMILLDGKDQKITKNITNSNKRFVKWKDIHASHPEIIKLSDMQTIIDSEDLFARKFDMMEDTAIMNHIDQHCLWESNPKSYHDEKAG